MIKCEKCGKELGIPDGMKARQIKKEIKKLGGKYLGEKKVICFECNVSAGKPDGWLEVFIELYNMPKLEALELYKQEFETIGKCPLLFECPVDDNCRECGLTFQELLDLADKIFPKRGSGHS